MHKIDHVATDNDTTILDRLLRFEIDAKRKSIDDVLCIE